MGGRPLANSNPWNPFAHGHGSFRKEGLQPFYEMEFDLEKGILKLEGPVRASNGEFVGTLTVKIDVHRVLGDALKYGWRQRE